MSVLDRAGLRALVTRIAAEPDSWRGLVRHGTPERHFEQLWRDDHVDVWVITWTNGNDTGFHDHDVSGGAVEHAHAGASMRAPHSSRCGLRSWIAARTASPSASSRCATTGRSEPSTSWSTPISRTIASTARSP